MKISPNSLCPCGSGKKYKKCYGLPDQQNDCNLFLKDLKDKMGENLKHTQIFMDEAITEISNSILLLSKSDFQSLRAQLVILMAFTETIAKLRSCFLYNKPKETDKEVFVEWFNKFVCIDKNNSWKELNNLHLLNGDLLYKLRCSLLHKLSIPNLSYHGKNIVINSNSKNENAKKLAKGIKGTIIFSPLELSTAIFGATQLMIDEINSNKDSIEYPKKLKILSNYLYKEGAVLIKL